MTYVAQGVFFPSLNSALILLQKIMNTLERKEKAEKDDYKENKKIHIGERSSLVA